MSSLQADDAFIIHRAGKDYKATVDQFAKDINIHVECCGGDSGGGGLDCQGVADCLANAPIDAQKYALAVRASKDSFSNSDDNFAPPNFPENASDIHVYCELCDPVDHHMLELGEEGHGFSGSDKSIFRMPGRFLSATGFFVAITAAPAFDIADLEFAYSVHPDIIFVKDVKAWKGVYEAGVTTTEDMFTTGEELPAIPEESRTFKTERKGGPPPVPYGFLQADGHLYFKTDRCDNFGKVGLSTMTCDGPVEDYGENFYRIEFTCHRGDKYSYVIIMSKHYTIKYYTTFVNEQSPDIQIPPMEDN